MQSRILPPHRRQGHCALTRKQFMLIDLYDKKTDESGDENKVGIGQ